ncbi:TonB-dependent receptor [Novosphingobium umbonatum]|uniref:TonB-dependent receptor n=1 Tax=Novosphingobium umbonatum TaxID=1908524 RepID=A0A3S2VEU4_9SPHN|nr:TonB-dependent receptor [Novosphingobium umbonatum]RVU06317.1 TonB-dependent receptor [Novosphingobium umbonatum]
MGTTVKTTSAANGTTQWRNGLLCTAAAAVLGAVIAAPAQAAAADPAADAAAAEPAGDIVVTGSRIVKDGFSAPTPVNVLSSLDIKAQAPANLSNFVNQLPAVTQGSTSANSSGSLSNGLAGINSVNLRGLGASRTLVLVDGQRSVASATNGVVDVNTVPQDLVERVEVVTGGASAQYGSDAVGGVVNFILNKKYKGFKLTADHGISTYGDARNYRISGSAGLSLMDDRLHVLINGEYAKQDGVSTIARSWNNSGYFMVANPNTAAGQPSWINGSGIGPSTYTAGGLITASTNSSLVGKYFMGAGQVGTLTYGAKSSSGYMVGGDYQTTLAGHLGTNSLMPDEARFSGFGRVGFDLTNRIELFAQLGWNRYIGESYYQQTPSTGVMIKGDNAYLQSLYPTIASALGNSSANSITIGTSNAGFPVPGSHNTRDVTRVVLGSKGSFDAFGREWKFDAYFQHGETKTHEQLVNTWQTERMALAQDAVYAPAGNTAGIAAGTIVCRSTLTNPTNGCVPINRLGTTGPSAASLAYIYGNQPWRDQTLKQDVAAASLSGDLFTLPGGTAAFAFGGEWRRESVSGYVPDEFQPIKNANGTTTSRWLYGNYLPNSGKINVKEAFLELDLPVVKGVNVNLAARGTDYSTSGSVLTYKGGATWQVNSLLKLRGTYSRDIRAPNLSELFAAPTARTNTVVLPAGIAGISGVTAGSAGFVESTIGNAALKPEKANTWTMGGVLTPDFLPGFTASFDYYDIKIKDAIGSVTAQNTVDFCASGQAAYCSNLVFSGSTLQSIVIQPFNFASQHAKGFDIEASYRTPLSKVSANLPGTLTIRGTTTHYIANVVDNKIFPIDYAGVNGGSLSGGFSSPNWVYRISAFYEVGAANFNLVYRGFSDGVYGNDYIECTSSCPTSSTQYRTINNNKIKGISYIDASVQFKIKSKLAKDMSLTFVVNNLMNKDPVLIGNGPTGNNVPAYAQTNRSIYDTIGRTFRISAKAAF